MNIYFLFPWCRTPLPFDSLSVLVVRGGAVCLSTPPSWFSPPLFFFYLCPLPPSFLAQFFLFLLSPPITKFSLLSVSHPDASTTDRLLACLIYIIHFFVFLRNACLCCFSWRTLSTQGRHRLLGQLQSWSTLCPSSPHTYPPK